MNFIHGFLLVEHVLWVVVFWKFGDVKIIDGFFVNGAARVVVFDSYTDTSFSIRIYLSLRFYNDRRCIRSSKLVAILGHKSAA